MFIIKLSWSLFTIFNHTEHVISSQYYYSNYQTYLLILIEDADDTPIKHVHSQAWPSSLTQHKLYLTILRV